MLMLTTITAALRKYSPRLSINLSTVCFRKLYITSLASSPYEISLLKEPQGGFHILSPLSQSVPAWPKPPFHSPFQESCAVIHHLWLWLPSILNTHNCLVFCSTANTEMFCAHFQTRLFKTLKIVFNGTTSFLFSTTAYNNHYPALTKKRGGTFTKVLLCARQFAGVFMNITALFYDRPGRYILSSLLLIIFLCRLLRLEVHYSDRCAPLPLWRASDREKTI